MRSWSAIRCSSATSGPTCRPPSGPRSTRHIAPLANGADAADYAATDVLADAGAAPLDIDAAAIDEPGSPSDGEAYSHSASQIGEGRGGALDFFGDDRGIDDLAEQRRTLRDHLGEQLRLGFDDPADRIIGAYLMALLCPAGRLTAEPAAIASALGIDPGAGRGGASPR